ncbi:MAG: hypothetical protein KOO60_14685 [Gemmatimonadales bacterium]|nr:hypothetical protein [Gemmatimonadales bacterium]
MKQRIVFLFAILFLVTGCSGGDSEFEARLVSYDAFAQKIYDALAWEDIEALVELCAQPGDIDMDGSPMFSRGRGSDDANAYSLELTRITRRFIDDLNSAGGTPDMKLIRIGKPIGLMGTEVDFVGNMFLIIELDGRQQVIEVGSSQLTSNRGRVLLPVQAFALKDIQYYQEMARIF